MRTFGFGWGVDAALTSESEPVVLPPANIDLPVVSGTLRQGQTLSVSDGTWANSPTGYSYQWRREGGNISGATGSTYVLTVDDVASDIDCVVTASNAGGSTPAAALEVGPILPLAPTNSVAPVISGTAQVGQVLSVSSGTWANSPTGYTYQWRRGGVNISGATGSTYTQVTDDIGAMIDCVVTASNAGGSTNASAATVGPVLPLAPTNSVLPAITGVAAQFRTLSVSNGTWANSPTGYTYQWRRGGVNISGATGSTHDVVAADVGSTLDCVVTGTNAGGSNSATSAATGTVLSPQPTSFSNVKFLSGFEGTNNSTTLDDESNSNHAITCSGNAKISTAQFKYGTSSLLLDGADDYVGGIGTSADMNFGSGAFSIEAFIYMTANSSLRCIINKGWTNNKNWILYVNGGTSIGFEWSTTGGSGSPSGGLTATTTLNLNTPYHIAVCRGADGVLRIFKDGVLINSVANSVTYYSAAGSTYIGIIDTNAYDFAGYIDEMRIIKGEGIYTQDFVPPQQAHPRS